MALDYATYAVRKNAGRQRFMLAKSSINTVAARTFSSWRAAGFPAAGAAPTTAAAPTEATTGAWGQIDSSGTQRILRVVLSWSTAGGLFTIADRLSHQGGLSGTVTTAQTTNLPTAALTRRTGGVGVMMGLEVYTQIGATGTTASASYTNQAGTAARTTPGVTFGNTGFREASRLIVMPLQVGDTGVRAVASVTVVATTGIAGAFGVTLFYPLVSIPIFEDIHDDVEALIDGGTWFPQVETDACLMGVYHISGSSTGVVSAQINLGED